jgi:hypothetical protein
VDTVVARHTFTRVTVAIITVRCGLPENRQSLPFVSIACPPRSEKTIGVTQFPITGSSGVWNAACAFPVNPRVSLSENRFRRRVEMKGITLSAALVVFAITNSAQAGLFGLFNHKSSCGCSAEPSCCAPVEASCCAPNACASACEPSCCAPAAASCCAPAACAPACEATCCAPAGCGPVCAPSCCAPVDACGGCNSGCGGCGGCNSGCGSRKWKFPKMRMPKFRKPHFRMPKLFGSRCGSGCGNSCGSSCAPVAASCCAPVEASCCAPCGPSCAAPCN